MADRVGHPDVRVIAAPEVAFSVDHDGLQRAGGDVPATLGEGEVRPQPQVGRLELHGALCFLRAAYKVFFKTW